MLGSVDVYLDESLFTEFFALNRRLLRAMLRIASRKQRIQGEKELKRDRVC
jgi:hypothetical protein